MGKTMRMTKQKKIIVEVLRSTKSHPTADWIYEQAKKQLPYLSLGTVYRNLNLLKNMGEIMELNYGSTYSRYDGNPETHYHFQCQECGKVYDLDISPKEQLDTYAEDIKEHDIISHRLEFYGICQECKQKKK